MRFILKHRHIGSDKLSEYLDRRLPDSQQQRVAEHLTSCVRCLEELEDLRSTVSLLRHLPEHTIPRSFTLAGPPPEPISLRPLTYRRT